MAKDPATVEPEVTEEPGAETWSDNDAVAIEPGDLFEEAATPPDDATDATSADEAAQDAFKDFDEGLAGVQGTDDSVDEAESPAPDASDETQTGWDKDRQKRDQELAAVTKDRDQMSERLQALESQMQGQGPAAEDASGEQGDLGDDYVDIQALEPLDEFATEEDRNARMNQMLQNQQAGDARSRAREQRQAQDANRQAFNTIVDEACKKHGAEHRNAIVEQVRTQWQDGGFNANHYPDAATTRMAVLGVAAQLELAGHKADQQKQIDKAKGRKPGGPRPQTGRRAGTVQRTASKGSGGSLEQEAQAMRSEGWFQK